ncbi:SufS family cysteine desulfurase [Patescibacteria group bacterium]|nr:SufS family cysteine desulfurase [Patescibacteria group bacterium]
MDYKKDFPIFNKFGTAKKPFIYFDSASTSQKPAPVIQAITDWYEKSNANIHRGMYELANIANQNYEGVRAQVAQFINAPDPKNIIFSKGTTESINLVAQAWAKFYLKKGDTILITEMEHHANIVPWQMLAQEKGLKLVYWPIDKNGKLVMNNISKLFRGAKLLSLTHVSNVLGTINPIEIIAKLAHQKRIPVLVDAAQGAPHLFLNVTKLKPDFLAFSSHKMLGPTGLGILYANDVRLKEMRPYQTGGDMIESVTKQKTTFNIPPWKFEAGTQPIAQVAGLGAALAYLKNIGLNKIKSHEQELTAYAYKKLSLIPQVTIYGPAPKDRVGVISFTVKGIHPHDIAALLDNYGIAIRAGNHCAQPLHQILKTPATARLSFYIYNNKKEIDYFIKSLKIIIKQWLVPII